MSFIHPVRVYFQDTDAGGVVYHAAYVNFLERARAEWLRAMGFSNQGFIDDYGIVFVVRNINVTYHKPAYLDDLLDVGVEIISVGRSQVVVRHVVERAGEKLTSAEVHLVCAKIEPFKPVAIPPEIKTKLESDS